ncbi:hypothetical protein Tco_0637450 [Tanacetum coccineum]
MDSDADEEEEQSRKVQRLTREEDVLLCECWLEVSENNPIGADRHEDSFWGQITNDFNQGSYQDLVTPANLDVKKIKSETTGSSGGSHSGSISESLYEDLRRKMQPASSAYKAKKANELAYMKCKELQFLMIDADGLLKCKAAII